MQDVARESLAANERRRRVHRARATPGCLGQLVARLSPLTPLKADSLTCNHSRSTVSEFQHVFSTASRREPVMAGASRTPVHHHRLGRTDCQQFA